MNATQEPLEKAVEEPPPDLDPNSLYLLGVMHYNGLPRNTNKCAVDRLSSDRDISPIEAWAAFTRLTARGYAVADEDYGMGKPQLTVKGRVLANSRFPTLDSNFSGQVAH